MSTNRLSRPPLPVAVSNESKKTVGVVFAVHASMLLFSECVDRSSLFTNQSFVVGVCVAASNHDSAWSPSRCVLYRNRCVWSIRYFRFRLDKRCFGVLFRFSCRSFFFLVFCNERDFSFVVTTENAITLFDLCCATNAIWCARAVCRRHVHCVGRSRRLASGRHTFDVVRVDWLVCFFFLQSKYFRSAHLDVDRFLLGRSVAS